LKPLIPTVEFSLLRRGKRIRFEHARDEEGRKKPGLSRKREERGEGVDLSGNDLQEEGREETPVCSTFLYNLPAYRKEKENAPWPYREEGVGGKGKKVSP